MVIIPEKWERATPDRQTWKLDESTRVPDAEGEGTVLGRLKLNTLMTITHKIYPVYTTAPSMVWKYWVLGSDWEPIRRIIYTTNAIESMNSAVRWVVRTRGNFPHDRAATKLRYLVMRNVEQIWRAPQALWHQARIKFTIQFGARFAMVAA